MKLWNLCKAVVQSAGVVVCGTLSMVEMAFDVIGSNCDCPYDEWDARQSELSQRQNDGDYYCLHAAGKLWDYAGANFKKAFGK